MILVPFYEAIMNRLLELKDEQEKPVIRFIDLWSNQTDPDEEGRVEEFPMPAVFIEYSDANWETLGNRIQQADFDFDLHIVSEVYTEHASRESEQTRSNALEHLKTCDAIHYHMQNYKGEFFGAMDRRRLRTGFGPGAVYHHIISYRSRVSDDAAMHKRFKFTSPNPEATVSDTNNNPI